MTALTKVPAPFGYSYAYRLIRGGWLNSGMVALCNRNKMSAFWMDNADASGGAANGQHAVRVAFVPYCLKNNNWATQAMIDCDATEVIGHNVETCRS